MGKAMFLWGFFLAVASQRSFVSTAPAPDGGGGGVGNNVRMGEDSVKELESLKSSLGRTLSSLRTQTGLFTMEDGRGQTHPMDNEEVKHNGELVAKLFRQTDETAAPEGLAKGGRTASTRVLSELDVPSEGIHKSVERQLPVDYPPTEDGNRKPANRGTISKDTENMLKSNSIIRQYSPLDMAEYVFWTGDEKGVSLAIQEFLQAGSMTKEEAIVFLQEIKRNLDYLKGHYEPSGSAEAREAPPTDVVQEKRPEVSLEKSVGEQIRSELNRLRQLQMDDKKRNEERRLIPETNRGKHPPFGERSMTDEDYEELLERLRLADFLYTEYSLEEVIYQLAKVMFTQSLTGGGSDAQQALTKFINFLEEEADKGHISRSLEKKILDVLIASLSDTLSEHPELLDVRQIASRSNENLAGQQQFLRQVLQLSPLEDKGVEISQRNTKPGAKGATNRLRRDTQMKIPFGMGK